ncbi:MAG: hypothetical protein SFU98_14035 [Leptospiraceae bacterium]|nr:hypothetical protein [Leptospiraceae bacterium]
MKYNILLLCFPIIFTQMYSEENKWNRLHSTEAFASSFLKSNWNKYEENYHPNYALDDNPSTAWVEGDSGNGEKQTITWKVSHLTTASELKLRIRNGYQKSKDLFLKNAMPKEIEVSVFDGKEEVVATKNFLLENKMGWQEIVIPLNEKGIKSINLEIVSVYEGKLYKDTCISDIQTFIKSTEVYNNEVENNKFKALNSWIKERVKTAKYFANLPATYPFYSSSFTIGKEVKIKNKEELQLLENKFNEMSLLLEEMKNKKQYYKAEVDKPIASVPDDLYIMDEFKNYIYRTQFSLSEVNTKENKVLELDFRKFQSTNFLLEENPKNSNLFITSFEFSWESYCRSESSNEHSSNLLFYSKQGLLESIFQNIKLKEYNADFFEDGIRRKDRINDSIIEVIKKMNYSKNNKIISIEVLRKNKNKNTITKQIYTSSNDSNRN